MSKLSVNCPTRRQFFVLSGSAMPFILHHQASFAMQTFTIGFANASVGCMGILFLDLSTEQL
ncbi:MAG TPA: hypothetical protein PKM63_10425 [Panacibacter sp.]|nr:hypothetical protein [Panacibacter sp.]HNP44692.1 hypothetical protein [Panacibacter sp.]